MQQSTISKKSWNLEYLRYVSLEASRDILYDNSSDLDLHFFNTNFQTLYATYILPDELQNFPGYDEDENISVLYLSSWSLTKVLKVLKYF